MARCGSRKETRRGGRVERMISAAGGFVAIADAHVRGGRRTR